MGVEAATPEAPRGSSFVVNLRQVGRAIRDSRLTKLQRYTFLGSLALVFFAVSRIPGVEWGNQIRHGWYHLFVVAWIGLVTYTLRSVGTREIVRFWVAGFFPVALITYILTEPLEKLIGTGNFQTAFWVPVVEELVKVAPLLLWTTIARPKHRHGLLSDFLILGFALGAGFSFHEDALYSRLVASGFESGLLGKLFPIFLTGGQYVITHAGWTALAAVGVGVFSIYRTRVWAWAFGMIFLAVPILDHAAVNWRGSDFLRNLMGDGRAAALLLAIAVAGVVAHDFFVMRWTSERDRLFPSPRIRDDLDSVRSGSIAQRLASLFAIQRYRRIRAAAFCDLYRVRSRGVSAGDRRAVISHVQTMATAASVETSVPSRRI